MAVVGLRLETALLVLAYDFVPSHLSAPLSAQEDDRVVMIDGSTRN